MDSVNKLVSIVIPCFNAQAFVREAIESALRQTYRNKEIIVIDDGSTDGSLDVIQSFGDRITSHTGPNRGACAARNEALRIASGTFVKFLDADDVLVSDAVERQVKQALPMAGEGDRIIVYGDIGRMNEDGGSRRVEVHNAHDECSDMVACLLEHHIQTSASLYPRQLLLEAGGFDERLVKGQEYELHLRLALAGTVFYYRSAVIAYLRSHASPSRIGNQDFISNDPYFFLKRCHHIRDLIKQSGEGSLTKPVRESLARETWGLGRAVCRRGYPQAAEKYFEAARSLSSTRHMVGTNLYRLTARLLGPRVAEEISLWREKARTPRQSDQDKETVN